MTLLLLPFVGEKGEAECRDLEFLAPKAVRGAKVHDGRSLLLSDLATGSGVVVPPIALLGCSMTLWPRPSTPQSILLFLPA